MVSWRAESGAGIACRRKDGEAGLREGTGEIICLKVPLKTGWLGSRVVSVLDSSAEGPEFKSQSRRRCRVTVLGKLFTPIVPLFTKHQNW